jgi:septum formation protein
MRAAPKEMPPLILASASPRRADLLRQMGLQFKVVNCETPEVLHDQLTPKEVAQVNAYRKARAVSKKVPDALVVGADTIVAIKARLFGKPASLEEAYEMLEELQGKTHIVVTAVCLLCLRQHRQRIFTDTTAVTFRKMDAVAIRRYLTGVNPLDKAGAYAIQEHGELIIERIQGSYSNVVGLPTEKLGEELAGWLAPEKLSPAAPLLAALAQENLNRPGAGLRGK